MQPALVEEFAAAFEAVRGVAHRAATQAEAVQAAIAIMKQAGIRSAAAAALPEDFIDALAAACAAEGIALLRPPYAAADLPLALDGPEVGITAMAFGVAESGTMAEVCTEDSVRLVSGLPRTHIGIVQAGTLVPRLLDAAAPMREIFARHEKNVTVSFISGPSRTGDIELILTLGVHGPEFAHAIIVTEEPA